MTEAPSPYPSPAQSFQEGEGHHALLLFDGVCNLCNGFVNFVIDNDPEGYFVLGALQSDAARPYLQAYGVDPEALNTLFLIENGEIYERSTAALRVARHLQAPWPLLYALIAVPAPLRDRVYDWVSNHRYQWFGKRNQCRVPTPDLQSRFLQQAT
ncbi:MAG: thiol-disulfide oxidoreductase DCC family protein [Salinibacter sp.]|uniref:thiol-disulfide oxidoreductase DCC family protein n=1 Tax=Salinibacter sp. TaxID=2065818 RepID=UPI0035D46EA0